MIFYLHIPKTGGQTLGTRLASAFPHQRAMTMLRDFSYPADVAEISTMAEHFDFVEGHVFGPLFQEDRGFEFVCTVRNPIDAAISAYHHIRREPRNMLHRPATLLAPEEFFAQFGDEFFNPQTNALIGAFHQVRTPEFLHGDDAEVQRAMYACCDRIRWLVPTEMIDDFTLLWQIETGRRIANAGANLNKAAPSRDNDRLRLILSHRLELFALDTDLWLTARKRYQAWRDRVVSAWGGLPQHADSRTVFDTDGASLRLLDGWHDPERRIDGTWQYWAGPLRRSRIAYRKPEGTAALSVRAVCFYGVRPDDVLFLDANDKRLESRRIDQDNGSTYEVALPLQAEGEITMRVPDVRSAMQVSGTSMDHTRRSVATEGWAITPA